jgi:uncharacterized repeat protein (TIGR01451 family)
MKRMKFSLIIVFILIMVSLLGTNLPPAVVAQPPTPLVLMCQRLGPDPVSVGDVIPFIAAVNDIDAWYYWEWTVNGTPEESSNTTYFASYFNFSRSVPGVYEVCVNVTGSSGKKDGPCCDSVTVVGPSLKIEKTGPGTVNAGDPLSYTITVTNNGSDIATGVIVVDDYDQGVLIITPTHGGADNGDTITWSGGSIAAGDFLSYTITADVKSTAPGG